MTKPKIFILGPFHYRASAWLAMQMPCVIAMVEESMCVCVSVCLSVCMSHCCIDR